MAEERLQKIIAAAGIASRRHAEELITQGRVTVNGQIVSTLGSKADPERDHIKVDGKALHISDRKAYFLLHKPKGYVTTVSDPEGRPTVMELVHSKARVFPVGRLDWNTEGLLLLTNDGDLTAKLTHASMHVPKTYMVKVAGQPSREDIQRLREGVMIGGEGDAVPGKLHRVRTAPAKVREVREADNPWYEVTLIEGRNRQVRRMFEAIGHHVEKIKRVRYGPLELDVPPGVARELRPHEIETLKKYVTEPIAAMRETFIHQPEPQVPSAPLPPARTLDKSKNFRFRKDDGRGARREFGARPPRRESGSRPPRERFDGRPQRSDERGGTERGGVRRYDAAGAEIPYTPPPREERPARGKSFGPKKFGGPPRFGGPKKFGERPPRREFGERPAGGPKRFGERPPRREFSGTPRGDRPPRREFGGAEGGERPKRFGGPKKFGSKPFGARPPRREFSDRPPRREFGARPPRFSAREGGERPQRFGGPKKFGGKPFGKPFVRRDAAGPAGADAGAPSRGPKRFGGPNKFGPKKFGGKPFGKPFVRRDAAGPAGAEAGAPSRGPKRFGKPSGGKPFGGPKKFGAKKFGGPKRFGKPTGGGRFGTPKRTGSGPRSDRGQGVPGRPQGGGNRSFGRFRRDKTDSE